MDTSWVVVAKYPYSSEAQIYKGRLEAEGIQVHLQDEYTIDTDPLMSHAIGGVKLKVRKEDEDFALEILEKMPKYSLTNEGEKIHCPKCNSSKIDYFTTIHDLKTFLAFLGSWIVAALPFYAAYEYRCANCKTKFKKL
ncbi:DUF2007 domain-containing protein [Mesonia sp. K4-1]|uniref:DUF2007 domain-containing protein n=1 Tax=Mesonia sp. K4-1 TaxID=2602760 RepID=UPI0011C81529|nr:DUF2007 domain-containing protein [Mesonia sp. K4-1]TXK78849.1 DUF2007 domain-containing protein [Mesonia sp. K4-1]